MNWRSAAAMIGIIALVCYLLRSQTQSPNQESISSTSDRGATSQASTSMSFRGGVSNSTDFSNASSRSRARTRPVSNISYEQADAEISRLISDDSVTKLEAAKGLLAIAKASRENPEIRLEALQHGLNLVSNIDYADMVLSDIDSNLFELGEMHRVILDDAYNREPEVKILVALSLYRLASGELKVEAREMLGLLTNTDVQEVGDDLVIWEAAVQRQLLQERLAGE